MISKETKRVVIEDYSEYDGNRCNNGGAYSFTTTYTRKDGEEFAISYSTSADFPYCPKCGSFYADEECPCGMDDYDTVSTAELEGILAGYEEFDDGDPVVSVVDESGETTSFSARRKSVYDDDCEDAFDDDEEVW